LDEGTALDFIGDEQQTGERYPVFGDRGLDGMAFIREDEPRLWLKTG
jgi:hypothetical protein